MAHKLRKNKLQLYTEGESKFLTDFFFIQFQKAVKIKVTTVNSDWNVHSASVHRVPTWNRKD